MPKTAAPVQLDNFGRTIFWHIKPQLLIIIGLRTTLCCCLELLLTHSLVASRLIAAACNAHIQYSLGVAWLYVYCMCHARNTWTEAPEVPKQERNASLETVLRPKLTSCSPYAARNQKTMMPFSRQVVVMYQEVRLYFVVRGGAGSKWPSVHKV